MFISQAVPILVFLLQLLQQVILLLLNTQHVLVCRLFESLLGVGQFAFYLLQRRNDVVELADWHVRNVRRCVPTHLHVLKPRIIVIELGFRIESFPFNSGVLNQLEPLNLFVVAWNVVLELSFPFVP